jgi:hypothetical protein
MHIAIYMLVIYLYERYSYITVNMLLTVQVASHCSRR